PVLDRGRLAPAPALRERAAARGGAGTERRAARTRSCLRRVARAAARCAARGGARRRAPALLRARHLGDSRRALELPPPRGARDLGRRGGDSMSCELSVVMPAYNERATLERAVEDVLNAGLSDSLELV